LFGSAHRVASCGAGPNNITYRAKGENSSTSTYTITVTNMTTSAAVTGCHGEGQLTAGAIAPGSRVRIRAAATFTPLTPFGKIFVGTNPSISRKTDVIVQGKSWT